ncbi:hypothetical protein ARMSODRAFT_963233 [Armillaria solidipes]|uniref:Uncharacterized protein n=1 Tax=Armillaria solidipes TaxID=1076256 RepID=A0A2H3BBB6_9AGAR|nr:hypothetical protein ARMSODRAFT_963233 [Armillaria solidipes]
MAPMLLSRALPSEDLSHVNRTRRLIYPDKRQSSLRLLMYHISSAKCCFFVLFLCVYLFEE